MIFDKHKSEKSAFTVVSPTQTSPHGRYDDILKRNFIHIREKAANFLKQQEKFQFSDSFEEESQKEQFEKIREQDLFIKEKHNERDLEEHERKAPYSKNLQKTAKQLKNLVNTKSLCMSYNKYTIQQILYVFQNPHKYNNKYKQPRVLDKLISLYLNWSRIPKIIILLSENKFPKLKSLNLGGNNCRTIEQLPLLCMPVLEELWLWNNNIVSTKPLRKILCSQLKVIDLNCNKINEIKGMRNMEMKFMTRFNLDSNLFANVDELINSFSHRNCKITIICNQHVKIMGKPPIRRRKKAYVLRVPLSEVEYC